MAKRGRKRAATESPLKPNTTTTTTASTIQQEFADRQLSFNNQEVQRRIAAIQAIQAAEVESLLSRLRLIRSYFTKEQLETPALKFFHENMPNVSVVRDKNSKTIELKWKDAGGHGGNGVGGVPFSVTSVKRNFWDAANLQIPDFVLDDTLENQIPGTVDSLQTPGTSVLQGNGNRLSFGMTPKTVRLPKKGEMLLSVRGSPLGVYKEDNLEAIHESGDGSRECAS